MQAFDKSWARSATFVCSPLVADSICDTFHLVEFRLIGLLPACLADIAWLNGRTGILYIAVDRVRGCE